jgi:adenylate kinase
MVRVVLLGPPGAGKGTQARVIADRLSVPAISTGDIFRSHVSARSELGRLAKTYLDSGDLVPDSVTVAMVRERLAEPDAKSGFLLDGFPRTNAQAEQLHRHLVEGRRELDRVIDLMVDEAELVERLSTRRVLVDGELVQRDDDDPDTVRRRLQVYRRQTAPLSEYYDEIGLLTRIDATGDVEDVTARILQSLGVGADGEDASASTDAPAR